MVEVIAHLHGDAGQDRKSTAASEIKDLRHEVAADDQFFEERVQANKYDGEPGDPNAQMSMRGLLRQVMPKIKLAENLKRDPYQVPSDPTRLNQASGPRDVHPVEIPADVLPASSLP